MFKRLEAMAHDAINELLDEYYDKDKKPILKNSLISFIDILGYKNLINSYDNQALLEKIYNSYIKHFNNLKSSFFITKTFSDNILIISPHTEEGNLGDLLTEIANFQMKLIQDNLLIRGSIVLGDIHVGEHILFGKGLIDAYELESKYANFSRVILSKEVEALCQEYETAYKNEENPYKNIILSDKDNYTFINYLNSIDHFLPYTNADLPPKKQDLISYNILAHEKMLQANFNKETLNEKTYSKYLWLKNYHNSFLKQQRIK